MVPSSAVPGEGTIAGKILMQDNDVLEILSSVPDELLADMSPGTLLQALASSRFSTSRSSEAMMRGTAYEYFVFKAIVRKPFVRTAFECGMVASKDSGCLACSPDIFELNRTSLIPGADEGENSTG